jgi:hypothetical protein
MLSEQQWGELVQVFLPDPPFVSAAIDVINVGNLLFVQILVHHSHALSRQPVIVAHGEPQQTESLCRGIRVRNVVTPDCTGESTDPGELVQVF